MQPRTDPVPGIRCFHYEAALMSEIARATGVRSVKVDLDAKVVTVHGDAVSDQAVRDAIDEAGYEVLR